jgi:hypothetical protein
VLCRSNEVAEGCLECSSINNVVADQNLCVGEEQLWFEQPFYRSHFLIIMLCMIYNA